MTFERWFLCQNQKNVIVGFDSISQKVVLVEESEIDALKNLIPYDGRLDHQDWCHLCGIIGGYCGNCGGGFWSHKNWQLTENGWQPKGE